MFSSTFAPAFVNTTSPRIYFSISPFNTAADISRVHISLVNQTTNENALTDRGESPYLAVDTVSVKFSEPGYMENVSDKKDDGYSYETVVDNTKEQIAAKTPPREEEQEEVHFHRGR